MRVYALYFVIAGLSLYAYRDWFKSLCGLILLMAVIEHPDMPKTIAGIQGLNPWNLLLVNVIAGWLLARRREGLAWDMPRSINVLLMLYLAVILIGFARMMSDRSELGQFTTGELISENLINTVKWLIPALLAFDGCRSQRRIAWGLGCTLTMYGLLALQVIRWMPPGAALSGAELEARSGKIILNEIGYHRVNMSCILSGASWAILSTITLARTGRRRLMVIAAFLLVSYAQALTGGRMGYVTWGGVGLVLCLLRWRRALPLFPLAAVVIGAALPGVTERMLQGFGEIGSSGESAIDDYEITAGRTVAWPYVLEQIVESPAFGYGRLAMQTTGLSDRLMQEHGESFAHPHNAYLQWMLDNGFVGLIPVLVMLGWLGSMAALAFRKGGSRWLIACGGTALSLLLAVLFASMGSQTWYPREGSVGMWFAISLCLRARLLSWEGHCHVSAQMPRNRPRPLAALYARGDRAVW